MKRLLQPRSQLILVLGGARSGKSTFAEQLAKRSGDRVAFIATATANDDEMQDRIARHRADRPNTWHTIEEPIDIVNAIRHAGALADVLLLDCMTVWLANWIAAQDVQDTDNTIVSRSFYDQEVQSVIADAQYVLSTFDTPKTLIIVSNEVGLGIHPLTSLGRVYQDVLGRLNQQLARTAEHVYFLVAGIAMDVKHLQEKGV